MATLNVVGYTQRDNGSWVKVNGTLTYSVSSTETSYTITLTSITSGTSSTSFTTYFKIVAGGTQLARVSFSSTGTKTITVSGTKTIQKTHATQTVALTMTNELAFKSNSSSSGQGPSATVNLSVSPKPSYVVSYDTQGGSSVPSQTKWYGEDLTLVGTPTKPNCIFDGWVLDEDYVAAGNNAKLAEYAYPVGDVWIFDEPAVFYAKWLDLPTLQNISEYRSDVGNLYAPEDEGEAATIVATLVVDKTFSSPKTKAQWKDSTNLSVLWEIFTDQERTNRVYYSLANSDGSANEISPSPADVGVDLPSATETSTQITFPIVLSTQASGLSPDQRYYTKTTLVLKEYSGIYASGTGTTNTKIVEYYGLLSEAFFTMDVIAGGHGIAFGGPSKEQAFVNYFKSKFLADVMFETMTGTIQMFGGTTPPNGWLVCDGSAVSRATYSTLFTVIGTTWGTGDGSTTFNLPDLRGRAPIGAGTGSGLTARTLGSKLGTQDAVVPYHNHTMSHTHNITSGGRQVFGVKSGTGSSQTFGSLSGSTYRMGATANTSENYAWQSTTGGASSTGTGYAGTSGNATDANIQPSAVVNFIICTGVLD